MLHCNRLDTSKILLLVVSIAFNTSGCTTTDSRSSITADELVKKIESGKPPLILDTRSSFEYESAHVPGALHLPFWKAFFADQNILDRCKTEPVIVYCQHGPRASFAGFALRQSGCNQVLELKGHMAGWTQQQLPVDTDRISDTTQSK